LGRTLVKSALETVKSIHAGKLKDMAQKKLDDFLGDFSELTVADQDAFREVVIRRMA
jgi:hypothetical protein